MFHPVVFSTDNYTNEVRKNYLFNKIKIETTCFDLIRFPASFLLKMFYNLWET
jgi:hypothetical protein